MEDIKIYFLGNKLGHSIHKIIPSNITNRRRCEKEAFLNLDGIKRTHFINKADILFFRNRGATTTDKTLYSLLKRIDDRKFIINDIRSFLNYDSKDRTFKIWKKNNLKCPDSISFSIDEINNNSDYLEKIYQFQQKYNKILLRTNNETGSKGLYVVEGKKQILNIIPTLKKRISSLIYNRKDTKLMCVEYVDADHPDNLHKLYRVHILFDKILSYYVTTSTRNEFHNVDMRMSDIKAFIRANKEFENSIPNIKNELINAVKVLGCNIGALEFFIVNEKPCFLELNPIWGGHASRKGFGDAEMMSYINTNKNNLINEIPNIYKWLDYEAYYRRMYSRIRDYYIDSFNK